MSLCLPILTFHSLDDRGSVLSFAPALFGRGLRKLRDAGYRTLRLAEAADCIRRGASFPDRAFVITFDDGYESFYSEALPALSACGMTATVFVTAGLIGEPGHFEGRPLLSWAQLREARRLGMDVGAHTLTHPDLTRLPAASVETEIVDSKRRIEDELSAPVDSFAYPFGRHDARSRDITRRHFQCACLDRLGLAEAGEDLYALARVDAYYLRAGWGFDLMLTRFFPGYVRARSVPRRIRRLLRFNR